MFQQTGSDQPRPQVIQFRPAYVERRRVEALVTLLRQVMEEAEDLAKAAMSDRPGIRAIAAELLIEANERRRAQLKEMGL